MANLLTFKALINEIILEKKTQIGINRNFGISYSISLNLLYKIYIVSYEFFCLCFFFLYQRFV